VPRNDPSWESVIVRTMDGPPSEPVLMLGVSILQELDGISSDQPGELSQPAQQTQEGGARFPDHFGGLARSGFGFAAKPAASRHLHDIFNVGAVRTPSP
jgi:hypothetical protein